MLLRRGLASAATAQAKSNPVVEPIQLKTSRLTNGMTVSSVDLQVFFWKYIPKKNNLKGPVTQLVFAFRSGSRYQQPDEGGLAHLLRNMIGRDSDNYLGMRLLWESAQNGANVDSTMSKDLHCVQMSVVCHFMHFIKFQKIFFILEPNPSPNRPFHSGWIGSACCQTMGDTGCGQWIGCGFKESNGKGNYPGEFASSRIPQWLIGPTTFGCPISNWNWRHKSIQEIGGICALSMEIGRICAHRC